MIRAALAVLVMATQAHARCADDVVEIRTASGSVAFSVEIADTEASRARGLMFRTDLPRDAGMLFVFEGAAPRAFWMENTPLPLDMLFFDAAGRLCGLVERAEPFTRTPRESGCAALAVLEINGGLAAELGIRPGAVMRHPAFGPGAAWSCR
jgi:uncharacterized membrane protein (UPF0127 family)